jgi:MFS family permease
MGIYGIGFPLGSGIGGFLSIWLIGNWGWRGPFFFSAIVTALLAVVAFAKLPESVGFLVQRHPAGALAEYNAIGAKLGLPPDSKLPAPTLVNGARPKLLQGVFSGIMGKRTVLLWISYATLIAAFYFANSFTAKLVTQSTKDNNIGIVAQALVSVGGVIGGLLFAALATRLHARMVTMWVMFFGTVAYFAFANFFSVTSIVLVLAVTIGMAANGGVAAYYAISPPIYPTEIRAGAVGLMMGFGRVIAFLAPNIAAYLLAQGLTAPNVYQVYGVVLAVSGVAVYLLHRTYSGANSLDAMQVETQAMEQLDAVH